MERFRTHVAAIGAGLVCFLALVLLDIARTTPPMPDALQLTVAFPAGAAGRNEPLVATGWASGSTHLTVAYRGNNRAVFVYEASNYGVSSAEVTYVPGEAYPLHLELPAIANAGRAQPPATGRLLFGIGGHVLLQQVAPYAPTSPDRIFLGENPVGGSTIGLAFSGTLSADGRRLNGQRLPAASFGARTRAWLQGKAWHLLPLIGLAVIAGWFARAGRAQAAVRRGRAFLREHSGFLLAAAGCALVFTWLMTGGKFRLIYPDAGGAIYDFQARSLLQGRLDLPDGAAGGEAFVRDGKPYIYFGPTPSLLRLPWVAFDRFGHLSRAFMLLQYLACLAAAYALLRHVTTLRGGPAAKPSTWATVLVVVAPGLGSTLLFLGSRAYIYHEALLCGAAFSLWTAYCSLRYAATPRLRWAVGALICTFLTLHARPPMGLFAVGMIGLTALGELVSTRRTPRAWIRPVVIGAAALLAFGSLNALAYLKFKTFNGAPLHLNIQYSPARLAKIDSRIFHLANVRHNLDAYVTGAAFKVGSRFPFVTFDRQRPKVADARIDLEEPTVSVPFVMTGLLMLAVAAAVSVRTVPAFRRPLAFIAVATMPVAACMLTFIATSQRYTADFAPSLIAAAVFGIAYFDQASRAVRRLGFATALLLTAFATAITLALSFEFQADVVWGTPEEVRANFLHLRARTDSWFGSTSANS